MIAPSVAQPFSALLLAGGRSIRMGRDKALLPHPVSNLPLLVHQAALLRSLPGCAELLLSAPADRGYDLTGPLAGARLVSDAAPDCGPLAGLAAGLAAATAPRLLVLAVDLPFVGADFLRALLSGSLPPASPAQLQGLVPRHTDGAFEPLCAVYPVFRDILRSAADALARRDLSLQRLLSAACVAGWMRPLPIPDADLALFENWNAPADTRPPSS